MIKVKESKAKTTVAKRTISITEVSIENGVFVDEEGNIAEKVLEKLPEHTGKLTLSICVELPDEE